MVIKSTLPNDATRLADKYVYWLYQKPVDAQGIPNVGKISSLLHDAKIVWIRNGEESSLSVEEMVSRLETNYYRNMKSVTLQFCQVFTNDLTPHIETKTVQEWDGEDPGSYQINSNIYFKIEVNPETNKLYIAAITQVYTSVLINSCESVLK